MEIPNRITQLRQNNEVLALVIYPNAWAEHDRPVKFEGRKYDGERLLLGLVHPAQFERNKNNAAAYDQNGAIIKCGPEWEKAELIHIRTMMGAGFVLCLRDKQAVIRHINKKGDLIEEEFVWPPKPVKTPARHHKKVLYY